MQFICKKLGTDEITGKPEVVNREDCDECDFYNECCQDGTLDEVDMKLGIPPENRALLKRFWKLAKRCQNALDPMKVDADKKAYSMLVLSGYPTLTPKEAEIERVPDFKDEELNEILNTLQVPASEGLRRQLRQATLNYFTNRTLWRHKPPYNKIKGVLERTEELLDELTETLNQLSDLTEHSHGVRTVLIRRLRTDGHDPDSLFEGIASLYNAVYAIIHGDPTPELSERKPRSIKAIRSSKRSDGEPSHKDIPILQKRLPTDMPFNLLIQELRIIFEKARFPEKAEIGIGGIEKNQPKLSPFMQFVYTFLKLVSPESII